MKRKTSLFKTFIKIKIFVKTLKVQDPGQGVLRLRGGGKKRKKKIYIPEKEQEQAYYPQVLRGRRHNRQYYRKYHLTYIFDKSKEGIKSLIITSSQVLYLRPVITKTRHFVVILLHIWLCLPERDYSPPAEHPKHQIKNIIFRTYQIQTSESRTSVADNNITPYVPELGRGIADITDPRRATPGPSNTRRDDPKENDRANSGDNDLTRSNTHNSDVLCPSINTSHFKRIVKELPEIIISFKHKSSYYVLNEYNISDMYKTNNMNIREKERERQHVRCQLAKKQTNKITRLQQQVLDLNQTIKQSSQNYTTHQEQIQNREQILQQ
ncbi:hypothetical protein BO83DRAFT_394338 [Aspergillus eucalypticola CBS 122712]|uniref:Uncharacterized protein n=1 Tax=Aspergillus eucalypticola (strain CBS 122712 / IBT 29274) TaxID=1448314 RepID=A0A317UPS7_ASPEC|nr:uncharacterized protein BO83DRAFT_394338 [Aspergillus eucalypticola CBS 122712]PWY62030.1 hypothetical protein BO83DRAFT_394338 [Aspergillus eucalypticola CBS 122712]